MTHADLAAELRFARRAVHEVMTLIGGRVRPDLAKNDAVAKADHSPVTVADFVSQAVLCRGLAGAFPGDPVVAEETSEALRRDPALCARVAGYARLLDPESTPDSVCAAVDRGGGEPCDRFWTLDPIDGTKGFLRGEQYVIALALVVGGEVRLGILGCPNLPTPYRPGGGSPGCLLFAVRGGGAMLHDLATGIERRVHVSPDCLRCAESYEPGHGDHRAQEEIARRAGCVGDPIRIDSQAKYGLVARGEAGALLRLPNPADAGRRENIWDHAAGSILVEEAGGVVTDADGRRLDFARGKRLTENCGLLAAAPTLHARLLEALAFGSPGT